MNKNVPHIPHFPFQVFDPSFSSPSDSPSQALRIKGYAYLLKGTISFKGFFFIA